MADQQGQQPHQQQQQQPQLQPQLQQQQQQQQQPGEVVIPRLSSQFHANQVDEIHRLRQLLVHHGISQEEIMNRWTVVKQEPQEPQEEPQATQRDASQDSAVKEEVGDGEALKASAAAAPDATQSTEPGESKASSSEATSFAGQHRSRPWETNSEVAKTDASAASADGVVPSPETPQIGV